MFGWFKTDPLKQLQTRYHNTLEQAMLAQRNGDLHGYADLMAAAEELEQRIDALEAKASSTV